MKRSKNLVTLSWEHHDGLVTVSRLKRGLAKKADTRILREYLVYIWQHDLQRHFDCEEKILINPVKDLPAGRSLLERFWIDHKTISGLAAQIENGGPNPERNIAVFAEKLEKHIRFEEREFFPFIEQHVSEADLQKIGAELAAEHRPGCKTWQPEFWK